MNLVLPIAAKSPFFSLEEYGYPKPLVEVCGRPMIDLVMESLMKSSQFKKIIFLLQEDDCKKFHLDDTLSLIVPQSLEILRLNGNTKGALCSVLMAIDAINTLEPLFISNADQIFTHGLSEYIEKFLSSTLDGACMTFNSVHPRWSYVRTIENGDVVEAAEKRPISRNAIAGFYMYKKGSEFIKFGMDSIKNSSKTGDNYYISSVFNEYILAGKKIGHYSVPNDSYHTFYSPQKINEYEQNAVRKK
jgi:dTDP-glucose pyrophosphorylase